MRGATKTTCPGFLRSWELAIMTHSASYMPEFDWARTNLLFPGLAAGSYKLKPIIYEVKEEEEPDLI